MHFMMQELKHDKEAVQNGKNDQQVMTLVCVLHVKLQLLGSLKRVMCYFSREGKQCYIIRHRTRFLTLCASLWIRIHLLMPLLSNIVSEAPTETFLMWIRNLVQFVLVTVKHASLTLSF
jgi:hypothetical protein